jgi:hypothetical protein
MVDVDFPGKWVDFPGKKIVDWIETGKVKILGDWVCSN